MSVLDQIAYFQNRRDEAPNQALAKRLAEAVDSQGIREIAEGLRHENQAVRADCLKVLYEIGYLEPSLVTDYTADFLSLLKSKNNRLVWGAMIALSTVAGLRAKEIAAHLGTIQETMQNGSVITVDNGIKILSILAATDASLSKTIFPLLLNHLSTCRSKDVPQHAEKILAAVNPGNQRVFIETLEKRIDGATAAQNTRLKKVIKEAGKR